MDLELDFMRLIECPVSMKESNDPDFDVPDPGTDEEMEPDILEGEMKSFCFKKSQNIFG